MPNQDVARWVSFAYLFPALAVFFGFNILPGLSSLLLSFFRFSGFDTEIFREFVGLENFVKLYEDKYFWIALKNTAYFVGSSVFVQTGIALMLSIFIFFGSFRSSVLIRSIIFLPCILAPVSVSLVWRKILEQDGVLNQILGLEFSYLSNLHLAIWLVVMVNTWQWVGYNLVIFYAGLQGVSQELLEAADIDGATWRQKIFHIVIPILVPTIMLNMVLNLIGSFRSFDIVYVLTRGGPAHYSEVLSTYMYYYTFASNGPNKMGVGAAIAFVMFAIVMAFGVARIILQRKQAA
jgi:ABC-type sugar transport system permease subunit